MNCKILLAKVRNFIVRQQVRINLAMSLLTIMNLGLLVITASDKLQTLFKIESQYYTYYLVCIIVPLGVVFIWIVGYILDVYVKYKETLTTEQNKRNPHIMTILNRVEEINNKIDEMKKNGN